MIAGVLALLAVVVVAGVLWTRGRGAHSEMEQGVALFRTGAYADAASHFFRYARSHPDEVAPHLYLARIHRRLERPDLAAPELKEALRIAPDDAGVHRELGFFFMDAGSYDAAIERFREALRLDPSSETAWVGMVQALRASGQTGMAESMLEQAPAEVQALLGGN
ncbi:MAG TPA: tetratricopeptide repeat protein [Longimicrobiaceae bacterium]|nr:tetratricopeptide repeat protein [Longimicrobiaceae bacterium]